MCKHLTCGCSVSSPPLNIGQYFSVAASTPGSYKFYTFFSFFLFSHLSHKLYPHHTWYIETTQTHMFSCSLTLLRRTSPPGKLHPLPHLWEERRIADGAVSTWAVFLEVNQTNETKGKKNIKLHKWLIKPTIAKSGISNHLLLSPASDGSCCFLLVYAKKKLIKMFKLCIDDIPVFCFV